MKELSVCFAALAKLWGRPERTMKKRDTAGLHEELTTLAESMEAASRTLICVCREPDYLGRSGREDTIENMTRILIKLREVSACM